MNESLEILKKYWGFDSFRKKQDQIINSVIEKKDTLALLPTGGGKSICYQVPGLQLDGVCIVISPLIALMQDQVDQLKRRNIKAVAISSAMSQKEIDIALDNAIYGNTKFLYISPERIGSRLFQVRLERMNISLIAVDEAHCISEWGYDFRPAYLNIKEIRKLKVGVPILALTATATPEVVKDIQEKLEFPSENVIQDSFTRDNLTYNVKCSNNKLNNITEYLSNHIDETGIIYCSTRKEVKNLCKNLIDKGYNTTFYHGGLDYKIRQQRQEDWISDKSRIMVCTNAFGMGIDKPNVRYVLHYDIPQTLEAYFQEAGRAGRDEQLAEAYLFYEPADLKKLEENVKLKYPELSVIKTTYNALGNYLQLAIGSGKEEVFPIDILDLADRFNLELLTTFNALKFLEIAGYISLSEDYNTPSRIKILVDKTQLYQEQVRDPKTNVIIQFLLRTQMGIFEDHLAINEAVISKHTKLGLKEVKDILNTLDKKGTISYLPKNEGTYITYLTERLDITNLSLPYENYNKRKEIALEKLKAMESFLTSNQCFQKQLMLYFGEETNQDCGKCLNCKKSTPYNVDIQDSVYKYINNQFNISDRIKIEEIVGQFEISMRDEVMQIIRWMIDHEMAIADELGKELIKP
ncbi:RecQ family ATP-dependent DNA helicase [Paracrocinitomix mangrovi]|uniref:RecQ family ATP-dependent DNA helicase n=1 Tax=Paracrocinitomix mangrovi TaxID=2862509 RepID=UPI001C8D9DA5|nr:ATP-dependent DNA helicase RecQ [Paracrocinitomix mangrovi]UKN02428.1 RecQ family ATP-dependent DNA helicase [Paracrocinitomix mangrovi]